MKKSVFLIAILILMSGCSSTTKVDKMAKTYEPVLREEEQVARIKSMINSNSKLNDEKKAKLIALVDEQAMKSEEIRKQQSQLRALLVDQLLLSSDGSNSEVVSTSKKLNALNKKNIKGLSDFILEFRSISGEQAIRENDFREAGFMHLF